MRLFFSLIVLLYSVELAAAELNVELRSISPQQGNILVGIYATAEDFERAPALLYENGSFLRDRGELLGTSIRADSDVLTATFRGLTPGRYGILAVHDYNGNGRLDRFFGIPMEPFAFRVQSVQQGLGLTSFADTSFDVTDEGRTVTIRFGAAE